MNGSAAPLCGWPLSVLIYGLPREVDPDVRFLANQLIIILSEPFVMVVSADVFMSLSNLITSM